jgi:hypothetical protein
MTTMFRNKSNDNYPDDVYLEAVLSYMTFSWKMIGAPNIDTKYDVSEMILLISTGLMYSSISKKIFTYYGYSKYYDAQQQS